jgi:hypothetical protein
MRTVAEAAGNKQRKYPQMLLSISIWKYNVAMQDVRMTTRDFFLRAKHWQIFPVFIAIFLAPLLVPSSSFYKAPLWAAILRASVSSIFIFSFVGWLWSMAHFLSNRLPAEFRYNKRFFRIACLYSLIFVTIFAFLNVDTYSEIRFIVDQLFTFIYLFCVSYVIYSVSRSLVLVEDGQAGYGCVWIFFLLFFFPAGVWVVQPWINRLFAEKRPTQPPSSDIIKYCGNCGKELADQSGMCSVCDIPPQINKFCQNCGVDLNPAAVFCIKCGVKTANGRGKGKGWFAALMLSIFLGGFGIDRIYLGYVGLGIMKLVTIGGCGMWQLIDLILIATGKLKDAKGNDLVKK